MFDGILSMSLTLKGTYLGNQSKQLQILLAVKIYNKTGFILFIIFPFNTEYGNKQALGGGIRTQTSKIKLFTENLNHV